MNPEELIDHIRRNLDSDHEIYTTSMTMYDPDRLQDKVSIIVFDNTMERNKFVVTVESIQ
jgi:hypothetical protein